MHFLASLVPLALAAASLAEAGHADTSSRHDRRATAAQPYAQCGGKGFSGATSCTSGWTCVKANDYYSQCVQASSGGKSSSSTKLATATTIAATSKATSKSTTKGSTKTTTKAASSTKTSAVPVQTSSAPASSSKGPVGYASLNGELPFLPSSSSALVDAREHTGGTTGGAGGSSITVSDLASLRNAVKGGPSDIDCSAFVDGAHTSSVQATPPPSSTSRA